MAMRNVKLWTMGAAASFAVVVLAPSAQAEDIFSNFFNFGRPRSPSIQMPFGDDFQQQQQQQQLQPRQRYGGGGQAFCVRTCDGRYFPVSGGDRDSREGACNSLCPSADTEVVYGSTIDEAATEKGKLYSKLPNAFRYRNELVAGCTCNGKDPVGLARVEIEKDTTLRSGDIVAGDNGLVVASKSENRRNASLKFSPASEKIKQRYRYPPVMAKE